MDYETNSQREQNPAPQATFLLESDTDLHPTTVSSAFAQLMQLMSSTYTPESGEPVTLGTKLRDLMKWVGDPANSTAIERAKLGWAHARVLGLFNSFNGIFREMQVRLNEADNHERIIALAQFNQMLAADYFMLLEHPEMREQRAAASQLSTILEGLSGVPEARPIAEYMRMTVAGARAQAGVMKLAKDNGAIVVTPDPEDFDEVGEWDVKGKADFAVVNQLGEVIFVDTKSQGHVYFAAAGEARRLITDFNTEYNRRNIHFGTIAAKLRTYLEAMQVEEGSPKAEQIQKAIANINNRNYRPLTVITPTHSEVADPYGLIFRQQNRTDILEQLNMDEVTDLQ